MLDVTERKRIEQRERQYADIVETIDIGLIVVQLRDQDDDQSLELVAANPSACAALDRPLDQFAGQPLHEALPGLNGTEILVRLADVARLSRSFEVAEIVVRKGLPTEQILACRAFPLGEQFVGISLSDVTDRALASQALRRQALHDALTGLPNRVLLQDRLSQSLRESTRSGAPVALLVMDLDQLQGDQRHARPPRTATSCCIELGEPPAARAAAPDTVARLGGDEFASARRASTATEAPRPSPSGCSPRSREPFVDRRADASRSTRSVGIALLPRARRRRRDAACGAPTSRCTRPSGRPRRYAVYEAEQRPPRRPRGSRCWASCAAALERRRARRCTTSRRSTLATGEIVRRRGARPLGAPGPRA